MHAQPRMAVFAGPSLPPVDRTPSAHVTYLPPAARGDVERVAAVFDVVLLIDGVFHHDLAPSPKECYAATRLARMYGASSMGALRAVECAPYGFLPLGAIANWYVREIIDGDDEVAVLTHPTTHVALTVPMVNVRYVAWLGRRAGILSAEQRRSWIDDSRQIFYMDRTWEDAIDRAPLAARDELRAIARSHGDLKRWDAQFALRSVLRRTARIRPSEV